MTRAGTADDRAGSGGTTTTLRTEPTTGRILPACRDRRDSPVGRTSHELSCGPAVLAPNFSARDGRFTRWRLVVVRLCWATRIERGRWAAGRSGGKASRRDCLTSGGLPPFGNRQPTRRRIGNLADAEPSRSSQNGHQATGRWTRCRLDRLSRSRLDHARVTTREVTRRWTTIVSTF